LSGTVSESLRQACGDQKLEGAPIWLFGPCMSTTKISTTAQGTLPLEVSVSEISAELDGSAGSNRSQAPHRQITADNDLAALKAFLARYTDTKATFENYRKEVERLFLWSTGQLRKPISSLRHEDLLVYQRFLADPQPRSRWVNSSRKQARGHPDWRPFSGPLSLLANTKRS
jgi:integrase/recombinase XerD